jgi:IclR family pca regulon transcriptional regulator
MLHGNKLISLFRREVPNLIYLRLPLVMEDLHARAMGKAVLAYMHPEDLAAFLKTIELRKLTGNTIVNPKQLTKDLELTKERGYSINNEEYRAGLISIGATIVNFNTDGAIGAVSLDFPTSEFTLEKVEINYTRILTKLASELSEILTQADL